MKEKMKNMSLKNEKTFLNKARQQESNQRDKQFGCPPWKIVGTILKMDNGGSQTNGQEDKKTNDDA